MRADHASPRAPTNAGDSGRTPVHRSDGWNAARPWVLVLLFGVSLFYSYRRFLAPHDLTFMPFEWAPSSRWIAAPGEHYSAFFRKEVFLPANVKRAWMAIAPFQGYEISVNGDTQARWFLWRATRPFQNGVSEFGQRVAADLPTLGLNFPREYQWTSHHNHALPVFIDLTSEMRLGRNVICVEVESRRAPARARWMGWIELVTGEKVLIHSDETWHGVHVPYGVTHRDWNSNKILRTQWPKARTARAPVGPSWRHVPWEAFCEPFQGEWMFTASHPRWAVPGYRGDSNRPVSHCYRTRFTLTEPPAEAALRVLSTRNFYVFINGHLVDPQLPYSKSRTGDEWVVNAKPPSPRLAPELLDPDEVGTLTVGSRYENPRHGDPTVNEFQPFENTLNRTTDRPLHHRRDDPAGSFAVWSQKKYQGPNKYGPIEQPDQRVPPALTRNRERVWHHGYGVANLLRRGDNEIIIRAVDSPVRDGGRIGMPRVAADLAVVGARSGKVFRTATGDQWQLHVGGMSHPAHTAVSYVPPKKLPRMMFRGHARVTWQAKRQIRLMSIGVAAAVLLMHQLLGGLLQFRLLHHAHYCVPSTMIIFCARLLELVMKENHETLYFQLEATWQALFVFAAALPLLLFVLVNVLRDQPIRAVVRPAINKMHAQAYSQRSWAVPVVVAMLVFGGGLLRCYNLDFQTLDDDEYASIQAALSIAQTGAPAYSDGIYYTRSPGHHYFAAAIVRLFGANIYALRMGQVFFGMGAGWLLYLCGSHILKSPWVGICALLLYDCHPFLIFSSHIARFYQQQQFFALLTVYLFYRGFVQWGHAGWRYGTLACFFAALMSQEISAVLGFSMALGFVVFVERFKTSDVLKLSVISACVLGGLFVDVLAFQALCLTRMEGVSPNVEATVRPNFTLVLNMFSMFISYARLHVAMTVFVVYGLLYAIRNRDMGMMYVAGMTFSGIVFAVTMISGLSLRYQYWVIAPWILMAAYGIGAVANTVKLFCRQSTSLPVRSMVSASLTFVVLASFCPWRIPGSYHSKLLGDATGAMRFVKAHMRPGDKAGATEPHPHAALIETGQSDFDIAFPLLWDFAHKDDHGYLRDRNANAQVVGSMADLQQACAKNDRIYFCLNREKFRSRGRNVRWEYPSARAELFLRQNCMLVHRTYLWSVYLWDKNVGHLNAFRREAP